MPTDVAARPRPTKVTFSDSLIRLIVTIFVVPAPFEITIGIVKRESYDFARLGVIMGALTVLALILTLLRNRRIYVQAIVGYYLVVAGLVVASFGVAVTFWGQSIVGATQWSRRAREELDIPAPANITSPRTIKIKNDNASLWRSDHFSTRPGADGIVEICKKYLSIVDLHFVAFYTSDGDCLFYLDFLDDDGMAHFDVVDTPERRRQYEQHGRHVRYLATKLDKRFRGLDSGLLIRIVLDVEKGALFFYNLGREGFLLGVTLDQSQVDPTDRKLSSMANEILVFRGGRPDDDFYRN
jgi:hypothetical protein